MREFHADGVVFAPDCEGRVAIERGNRVALLVLVSVSVKSVDT